MIYWVALVCMLHTNMPSERCDTGLLTRTAFGTPAACESFIRHLYNTGQLHFAAHCEEIEAPQPDRALTEPRP